MCVSFCVCVCVCVYHSHLSISQGLAGDGPLHHSLVDAKDGDPCKVPSYSQGPNGVSDGGVGAESDERARYIEISIERESSPFWPLAIHQFDAV